MKNRFGENVKYGNQYNTYADKSYRALEIEPSEKLNQEAY